MKVAVSVCILFAVLWVDVAWGLSLQECMRWHKAWLSVLCKNDDENLNNEIDDCMGKGVENVGKVFTGCMKEVDEGFTNTFTFRKSACPDTDKYAEFQNCLENHAEETNLVEKINKSTDAEQCLYSTMEKYGKMNDDLKLRRDE